MAFKAKSFLHNDDKIVGADGDADGTLPEDVQDYITSVAGTIDVGILSTIGEIHIKDLMGYMKNKDFTNARKWAVENLDSAPTELFRKLYDGLHDGLSSSSVPQAILVLAEYQYKSALVADQEINLVACIVELMMGCEFK